MKKANQTTRMFRIISVIALVAVAACAKAEDKGAASPAAEKADDGLKKEKTAPTGKPAPPGSSAIEDMENEATPAAAIAHPSAAKVIETDAVVNAAKADPKGTGKAAVEPSKKAAPQAKFKVAETSTYTITVDAPATKVGASANLVVRVVPKKGWKLNMDFPTKVKLEPPAGVDVDKKVLKKGDAKVFSEKKGATWRVGFKSASAGKKKFSGEARFAVCTDATCDPKKASLAFAVSVD